MANKLIELNETIAGGVTEGYKKIENGVVGGYKKIEEGVVGGFNKMTDKGLSVNFSPATANPWSRQSPAWTGSSGKE